jgi:hypothetical protein
MTQEDFHFHPVSDPKSAVDLTHLSLFSGIGAVDFAAELAGFKNIGMVELAHYPFRGALRALARCEKVERCL